MKRWNRFSLRAVAMVLSLVLMLTMVPYVRATETEEETGTTFHAPTIG